MPKTNPVKKSYISVIIPAFNEEKTIGNVIRDVQALSKKYFVEIIVVNDGSTDLTEKIARKAGAHKIISHQQKKGKGAAFRSGLRKANGTYIVQIDADGQLSASEIPKLINHLENGFDMVLGTRYKLFSLLRSDFTSLIKMSGNIFLSLSSSIATRKKITDVMTGMKAFKKSSVLQLDLTTDDFGYEAELVVKASKKKQEIKSIVISCKNRETGKSNLKVIKHGLLVFKTIVSSYLED